MTEKPAGRPLPAFFVNWRSHWTPGDLDPTDYLDLEGGIAHVLAAQWLFCPDFVTYRGGIFFADRFDPPNLDDWFDSLGKLHETECVTSAVEEVANHVHLWDVFGNTDTDDYEDDLQPLAHTLAECWQALARQRFPDLTIVAGAEDESDSGYGPTVSIWQPCPHADAGGRHPAPPGVPG